MPETDGPEIQALKTASAGLLYPSESDVPFDVFLWKSIGPAEASARDQLLAYVAKDRRIEEVAAEPFFNDLVSAWEPGQLEQLRRTLQSELVEVKVFRVGAGDVEVDIYVLSRTPSGDWAGLHTMSVET